MYVILKDGRQYSIGEIGDRLRFLEERNMELVKKLEKSQLRNIELEDELRKMKVKERIDARHGNP